MIEECVLDASIVLKWMNAPGEQDVVEAERILTRFLAGELRVVVPPLLFVEVLNVAARRWRLSLPRLERLAARLDAFAFEVDQPALTGIARWCARGLTAYDACYVALAEARGITLITADEGIVASAPRHARRLGGDE
ncbi:MAG: PIN domain-containing protein [Chloroflexota bacterium]|nr:MAG: PIN domain-containing protein [Chloroflexota bacterium]